MENITLKNCDFLKLLPLWMRKDQTDISLSESINDIVAMITPSIDMLSKWTSIDSMSEKELDEMAWELDISWYQYDADISKKRSIVKNARKIHRKSGTKWAIEQVLTVYFDESKVLEWFEYGGKKGHFKIQTYNTATVDRDAERFLKVLNDVKRFSQILDEIEVLSSSTAEIEYVIRPRVVDKIITIMKE